MLNSCIFSAHLYMSLCFYVFVPAKAMAGLCFWVIRPSIIPSVLSILISAISQERQEGISSDWAQMSTWIQMN